MSSQWQRAQPFPGSSSGLGVFLSAIFRLGQVALLLRLRGYQRVVRQVGGGEACPRGAAREHDFRRARRYARWIDRASRCFPARVRCLHRSLVLHGWLRREGLPSIVRIGVLKDGNMLVAHAWVELDGRIVNDSAAAVRPFTPLAESISPIQSTSTRPD